MSAMFVVFGAIRLARFNVTTGTYEPNIFIGLPIPTAAIVSALWTGIYLNYSFTQGLEWAFIIAQGILAILMVSNIRYPSFKKVNFKQMHVLRVLAALVVIFSLLYLFPLESAAILMSAYTLYGIIRAIYLFTKTKKEAS